VDAKQLRQSYLPLQKAPQQRSNEAKRYGHQTTSVTVPGDRAPDRTANPRHEQEDYQLSQRHFPLSSSPSSFVATPRLFLPTASQAYHKGKSDASHSNPSRGITFQYFRRAGRIVFYIYDAQEN